MRNVMRIPIVAGLLLACLACTKPEPPDKEQPVEPQAEAAVDARAAEVRDAVREPIERAEAVEDAVMEAAEKQRAAIDAATGN